MTGRGSKRLSVAMLKRGEQVSLFLLLVDCSDILKKMILKLRYRLSGIEFDCFETRVHLKKGKINTYNLM